MSQPLIAVPSPKSGWDLYRGGVLQRSAEDLHELCGNGAGVTVAVPAQYASTFLVNLPTVDASVLPDMAYAQVERRGLGHGGPESTVYAWQTIRDTGKNTELGIDVLSDDFPETWCLPKSAGYYASARLIDLPDDKLFLWREHKRLVLTANHGGRVSHVQVISAGSKLSEAVAQEINLTSLSLQGEGAVVENPELVVAGDFSADERAALEKALILPVEFLSAVRLRSRLPGDGVALNPALVTRAWDRRRRGRQRLQILAVVAVFYAAAITGLWFYSKYQEEKITSLEREAAALRPEAEWAMSASERWRALEPAIDLRYYPLVQLNQITRVMPPSGVVVREFETKGRSIRIRGRARDAQLAFRFEEGLEANEALGDYEWSMPSPQVERDNSASFDIRGEWAYAESE